MKLETITKKVIFVEENDFNTVLRAYTQICSMLDFANRYADNETLANRLDEAAHALLNLLECDEFREANERYFWAIR